MRQQRIAKKPRRRTTRKVELVPLDASYDLADLSDIDAVLAEIDQVIDQVRKAA